MAVILLCSEKLKTLKGKKFDEMTAVCEGINI
jgi:hypothetical protein